MLILFIIQLMGYWLQTDWSGNDNQYLWVDTSSYYKAENINGKLIPGKLNLFAPSGRWQGFRLPSPGKEVNAIVETEPGVLYIGSGWDSACVFKFGNFGETFIFKNNFGPGKVLCLLKMHNDSVLVGTSSGKLYRGINTHWENVATFDAQILALYQPPDFPYIYLADSKGRVWVSTNDGWSWQETYPSPFPNTQRIFEIFESSAGIFYACTKSQDARPRGRLFWADEGLYWDSLYSFNGADAVYSICEGLNNELYVSTGHLGKIFTSSDSGKHWQEINSPWRSAEFYNMIIDVNNILYVAGRSFTKIPKGIIYMSKDKGRTWDTLFISIGWRPTQIFSLIQSKSGIMFAGGDTSVVFRSGYCDVGWLESSIYDVFEGQPVVNRSLKFGLLHFRGSGSIGVRVRSSFTLDSMPEWGRLVPSGANPVNYGSARDGDRYIQYRVELSSAVPTSTPMLDEICIKYEIDVQAPGIDSAVAFDGDSADPSIDLDDYVIIWFDEPTNTPRIETYNIDKVLRLSKGHSWRSDSGRGVIKYPGQWITPSTLKIYLSTMRVGGGEGYPPTVAVGDTIYPDSITIQDKWNNACYSPCVIKGRFGVEEKLNPKNQIPKMEIAPNPFIRRTTIKYQLIAKTDVSLRVYDVAGKLIKILVDEEKPAGLYSIEFQSFVPGVYFIKMTADWRELTLDRHMAVTQKVISF